MAVEFLCSCCQAAAAGAASARLGQIPSGGDGHGHQLGHVHIKTREGPQKVAKKGAQILEERVRNGRHVCWVAAPDGAQMELIEKV
jgi:hypothetical protein